MAAQIESKASVMKLFRQMDRNNLLLSGLFVFLIGSGSAINIPRSLLRLDIFADRSFDLRNVEYPRGLLRGCFIFCRTAENLSGVYFGSVVERIGQRLGKGGGGGHAFACQSRSGTRVFRCKPRGMSNMKNSGGDVVEFSSAIDIRVDLLATLLNFRDQEACSLTSE